MPFGPAAAAAAGAVVSGGIGLLGSKMQSDAVKSGSREANLLQLIALDRTRGDLQPYNAAGQGALGPAGMASGATGEDNALFNRNVALRMSGALGEPARLGAPVQNVAGQMAGIYGEDQRLASPAQNVAGNLSGIYGPEAAQAAMANFQTSPGYQWRMEQGLRAINADASASGMWGGGAVRKAEQKYAQGLASEEYNKYLTNAGNQFTGAYGRAGDQFTGDYNRATDAFGSYYSRLYDLARLGANAAGGQATANTTTGTNMAKTAIGAADAQSSLISNATKGLAAPINGLFNNAAVQDQVKNWFSPDVPSATVANNALYQQAAFNQYPTGTYGPFQ